MTFTEIVAEICDRLNYSSTEATTRVGKRVNSRYKRATSSIGLSTSRFTEKIPGTAVIGSRVITFNDCEKVLAVIDTSSGTDVPLEQISVDEMHITPVKDEPPRQYCVLNTRPSTVEIKVDGEATTTYVLYADGISTAATLAGADEPQFPESYHDILVFGVLADEYRKLEKFTLAKEMEGEYEKRLSDLRMWIAKTSWEVYQGRYSGVSSSWDSRAYWNR